MKVRHGFAAIPTVIDHQPVAAFLQTNFPGYFGGFEEQMAEQRLILAARFGDARDGLLWHDENVSRRLRRDIPKGQHEIIFVNDLRRDLARDDLFKQSHGRHQTISAQLEPDFSAPRQQRR